MKGKKSMKDGSYTLTLFYYGAGEHADTDFQGTLQNILFWWRIQFFSFFSYRYLFMNMNYKENLSFCRLWYKLHQ